MASQAQVLAVLAILAAAVLPFAMATDFIVGDDDGWGLTHNYTAWAEGKEFRVGDNLIFKYAAGKHNVIEVGRAEFKACEATASADKVLTSGNDVVTLSTPGNKWYICGFDGHCQMGQKLVITVLAGGASAPASPPPPAQSISNRLIASYPYQTLMVAAAAAAAIIVA